MSRVHPSGQARWWFVPSIANKNAPTVAEINAGIDLTPYMRRDGANRPRSANTVDIADLASPFNKTAGSTYGGDVMEIPFNQDQANPSTVDPIRAVLSPLPSSSTGFIVARDFGGSSLAPATGHRVDVMPVQTLSKEKAALGDQAYMWTARFAVTDTPVDDVALV